MDVGLGRDGVFSEDVATGSGGAQQSEAREGSPAEPIARNLRFPDQIAQGRLIRWKREHAALNDALMMFIRANLALGHCGPDIGLEKAAEEAGFRRFDLVIARAVFGLRVFGIICVPTRIWRSKKHMRKLLLIKADAAVGGQRTILVPASSIVHSQRYANALALASSRSIKPSRSAREKIIGHLKLHRRSSVRDCANLVSHYDDPTGIVLNLALNRWLQLSPGAIGPDTVVTVVGGG